MTLTWTLKEARDIAKLTQDELAAKSGVDQTTISALETFRRTNPTLDTVEKLANAMGIPMVCLRFKPQESTAVSAADSPIVSSSHKESHGER